MMSPLCLNIETYIVLTQVSCRDVPIHYCIYTGRSGNLRATYTIMHIFINIF